MSAKNFKIVKKEYQAGIHSFSTLGNGALNTSLDSIIQQTPLEVFTLKGSNLGIGLSNPIVSLDTNRKDAYKLPSGTNLDRPTGVQGYIRYNTESQQFEGFGTGNQWGSLGGVKNVAGDTYILAEYTPGNNDKALHFYTDNLERMTLTSNGNLGIGSITPNFAVDVIGDVNFTGILRQNGTPYISSQWTTNGNNIYYNGNVGIQTSAPLYTLDVNGSLRVLNLFASNLTVLGDTTILNTISSNTEQMVITNAGTGPALKVTQTGNNSVAEFYDNESGLAMTIANNGNVGIGTTAPLQKLHVEGKSYLNGLLGIGKTDPLYALDIIGTMNITDTIFAGNKLEVTGTTNLYNTLTTNNNNINAGTGTITASTFSGTATKVSQDLIKGAYLTGANYNGAGTTTWAVDATTAAIASKIVARDTNGIIYAANIGIGTTSALYAVDVTGDVNFTGILRQNGTPYISSQWTTSNGTNIYYNGNVGIGTINPLGYNLNVNGDTYLKKITTSNLVILQEPTSYFQITPVRKVFYIDTNQVSTFTIRVNGIYGGEASNIQCFVNNNLQGYYSSSIKDYDVSYLHDLQNKTTDYVITLTYPATYGSFVDITVTPKIITQTDVSNNLMYQNILLTDSYFSPYGNNVAYTSGNVGIGTTIANSGKLVVAGNIVPSACNVYDLGTTNLRWRDLYLSGNTIDLGGTKITQDASTGGIRILNTTGTDVDVKGASIYASTSIGIGTTVARELLDVQGGNAIFSGNIGIKTANPNYTLHVNGPMMVNDTILTLGLGIGTTVATQALHVVGNVLATGTITASNISVIGDFVTLNTITSNTEQMVVTNAGTGPALKVTQTGAQPIAEFYDNESGIAMTITNNGNVGIGITNPQSVLHVVGNILATQNITCSNVATINNTPIVTWISGHSNYDYIIDGTSYNSRANGSHNSVYAPMVIVNNRDLYIWGSNIYGQLNIGTNPSYIQSTPMQNSYGSLSDKKIVAVSGTPYFSAAIDDNGALHMWGNNAAGQLGIGTYSGAITADILTACNISTYGSLSGKKIIAVSCAQFTNTIALDSTGQVHAWGANNLGQIGFNSFNPTYVTTACNISSYGSLKGRTIVAINQTETYSSIALDNTGQVHVWGANNSGSLGFGNTTPLYISACNISSYGSLNGKKITAIAAGGSHFIALDSTAQVHTWGYNIYGQLGIGATTPTYLTTACNISSYGSLSGKNIIAINAGYQSSYALDSTGQLHSWGFNNTGELGLGTITSPQLIPINISSNGSLNGKTINTLSTDYLGVLALDNRGSLHKFGYGFNSINTSSKTELLPLSIPTFKKENVSITDYRINFEGPTITSDNYLSGIEIKTKRGNSVVINDNGNVGIGSTAPQSLLDVNGNVKVSGTTIMNGNVGIGTTAPQNLLDVNGTIKATSFNGNGASLTALNANNISSGTLNVAYGGTGLTSLSGFIRNVYFFSGTTINISVADGSTAQIIPTSTITVSQNSKLYISANSGQILKNVVTSNPTLKILVDGVQINNDDNHKWFNSSIDRVWLQSHGISNSLSQGNHTVSLFGGTYGGAFTFNYQEITRTATMVVMEILG